MARIILTVFACTVAGIALGFGFGLLVDSVSPSFSDRLLGTAYDLETGPVTTPGLNLAVGMANGGWMGFAVGMLAVLVETFLTAKRLAAGLNPDLSP